MRKAIRNFISIAALAAITISSLTLVWIALVVVAYTMRAEISIPFFLELHGYEDGGTGAVEIQGSPWAYLLIVSTLTAAMYVAVRRHQTKLDEAIY